ncbi:MAG: hypothetical protein D6683_00170 [Actinomyces sp.]|nr:MAG: hypothetical protein D6683_00170 [Actinomyces sp.]
MTTAPPAPPAPISPARVRRAASAVGSFRLGLAAIATAGLTLRLWVVLVARPTCGPDPAQVACFRINGDALYHFTQARLIADGHWFENGLEYLATGRHVPSAGDPPGFALLLALWSWLGFDTVTWARVWSCAVGAVTIVLVGLLARHLAGDRAGLVAAGVAAVHPLLWINDAMVMSELLYQPVIVALMWAAVRHTEDPTRRAAALVGVGVAAAALVRGEAVTLGVFLLVPLMLWARQLGWRERLTQLVLAGVVALAVMAPWVVWNNLRFADPVTLTAASGSVLMAGSCDSAWSGPDMGFWADCFTERGLWDEYEAAFPGITAPGAERVVYDESLVDTFNRDHALEYLTDHLDRYPLVAAARVGRAFDVFRVGHTLRNNWELEGRWRGPSTVGLVLYYLLWVPALVGALALRRRGVRLTPLLAVWPMVAFAAATTFGLTRYRVPVDLSLIVLAGVGVAALLDARRAPA